MQISLLTSIVLIFNHLCRYALWFLYDCGSLVVTYVLDIAQHDKDTQTGYNVSSMCGVNHEGADFSMCQATWEWISRRVHHDLARSRAQVHIQ